MINSSVLKRSCQHCCILQCRFKNSAFYTTPASLYQYFQISLKNILSVVTLAIKNQSCQLRILVFESCAIGCQRICDFNMLSYPIFWFRTYTTLIPWKVSSTYKLCQLGNPIFSLYSAQHCKEVIFPVSNY